MPRGIALTALIAVLLAPGMAHGQGAPAPYYGPPGAPPETGAPPEPPRTGAPPASEGFQMSLRTGASFPMGSATGSAGDALSGRYAWQLPLALDLGVKLTESVFLGAYLGFGIGAEGSDFRTEGYCDDDDSNLENDVSCSAHTVKVGLEARYSFHPGERWSPWIGYGAGFETATAELDDQNDRYRESTTAYGFTVAKLSGGADYRAGVGVGPFAEVAVGTFTQTVTEVNDGVTFDGAIDEPAWHAWLTVGIRMVLFP